VPHIVWDWNGTLLDDLEIVVDAVNAGLAAVGWDRISVHDYRTHYTRPVRTFYERLAGRDVHDDEWRTIDRRFHDVYQDRTPQLARDATDALRMHAETGRSQSLLSMYPHADLIPLVEALAIADHFERIDGLRGESGGVKAASLRAHLEGLSARGSVVVIGDTPDDLFAASASGVGCVLYDGGSHHRADLESHGVPVASTLVEAVKLATQLV
jgi:phosphoglycolate phosphatase-like HAD superfamily hydrolase